MINKINAVNYALISAVLIGFLSFTSCKSSSKSQEKQEVHLPNEGRIIEMLKDDLKNKMKIVYEKHPEAYKDTTDFEIHYSSVIHKTDFTGVYIYSAVGSHGSRNNFFTYDKDGVHIININDINTVLAKTKSFLKDQGFTDIEQKNCLEKINSILIDNTTDSF